MLWVLFVCECKTSSQMSKKQFGYHCAGGDYWVGDSSNANLLVHQGWEADWQDRWSKQGRSGEEMPLLCDKSIVGHACLLLFCGGSLYTKESHHCLSSWWFIGRERLKTWLCVEQFFLLCVCVCVYVRDTTLAALFLIHSLCFIFGFVLHSCFSLSVFVHTFFVWLTGVSTYMLQSMSPPPPVAVTFVEKRTGQPCICWNGLSHDGMEIGS